MCAYGPARGAPYAGPREPVVTLPLAFGMILPWIAAFSIAMFVAGTGPDASVDMGILGAFYGGALLALIGSVVSAHYRNIPLTWVLGLMAGGATAVGEIFFIGAPIDTSGYNQPLAIAGAFCNPVLWGFGIAQLVRLHRIKRDETRAEQEAAAQYWAQQYYQYQQQHGQTYGPTGPPQPYTPYQQPSPTQPQPMPVQIAPPAMPSPPPLSSASKPAAQARTPSADGIIPGYSTVQELWRDDISETHLATRGRDGLECWLRVFRGALASNGQFVEAFQRELVQAARLFHVSIPAILESGASAEVSLLYIVTQAVAGKPLGPLPASGEPVEAARAVAVLAPICEVADYAHSAEVLHLDVRPEHIIIADDGDLQLTGFGVGPALVAASLAGGNESPCKGAYLSPEHTEGGRPDGRSDVYSLGVILYRMLTGRLPFEGESAAEVMEKHRTQPPPDPLEFNPGIGERLRDVVLKTLAKDPAERPQSALELAALIGSQG